MPRLDNGTYRIPASPTDTDIEWVNVEQYSAQKGKWVRVNVCVKKTN